jgi:hypothetical protein
MSSQTLRAIFAPEMSRCNLDIQVAHRPDAKRKQKLLTVRIDPVDLDDFAIAAELKGATMSGLVHQFVRKTIREEKERDPKAFSPTQPAIKPAKVVLGKNLGETSDERKKGSKKRA